MLYNFLGQTRGFNLVANMLSATTDIMSHKIAKNHMHVATVQCAWIVSSADWFTCYYI